MSKKKGLSMEEKVVKVEEYFHENPVPFTLKELMVNIPKAKGVIFQSVEECLELLISENRVCQEKIGISVFYWHFPEDKAERARAQHAELTAKAQQLRGGCAEKEAEIAALTAEKFAGDADAVAACQQLQQAISELTAQQRQIEMEIAGFASRDPAVIAELQRACEVALEGANRWTDNIFLIEDYCTKRMGISRREFRQMAKIPAQLDFLE